MNQRIACQNKGASTPLFALGVLFTTMKSAVLLFALVLLVPARALTYDDEESDGTFFVEPEPGTASNIVIFGIGFCLKKPIPRNSFAVV